MRDDCRCNALVGHHLGSFVAVTSVGLRALAATETNAGAWRA
jgi:hypothetical protein